jgi:hypothetical protein
LKWVESVEEGNSHVSEQASVLLLPLLLLLLLLLLVMHLLLLYCKRINAHP